MGILQDQSFRNTVHCTEPQTDNISQKGAANVRRHHAAGEQTFSETSEDIAAPLRQSSGFSHWPMVGCRCFCTPISRAHPSFWEIDGGMIWAGIHHARNYKRASFSALKLACLNINLLLMVLELAPHRSYSPLLLFSLFPAFYWLGIA